MPATSIAVRLDDDVIKKLKAAYPDAANMSEIMRHLADIPTNPAHLINELNNLVLQVHASILAANHAQVYAPSFPAEVEQAIADQGKQIAAITKSVAALTGQVAALVAALQN